MKWRVFLLIEPSNVSSCEWGLGGKVQIQLVLGGKVQMQRVLGGKVQIQIVLEGKVQIQRVLGGKVQIVLGANVQKSETCFTLFRSPPLPKQNNSFLFLEIFHKRETFLKNHDGDF